jgi:hypothetical protein
MKLLKILAEVQNKATQIKEYINSDMIRIKDYFTMSPDKKMEYLPKEYYYMFNDYISDTDTDFEYPKGYNMDNPTDTDEFELIKWIGKYNMELYRNFSKYLYDKIQNFTLPINTAYYPTWAFFRSDVKIIKNQWLIHFTNSAKDIENSGFKYGVKDYTMLGLTLLLGDFEKEYGGYNFAFRLESFQHTKRDYYDEYTDEYSYGKEVVIFRASGIEGWHNRDGEYQVLFYGNTAKNIVAVTKGDKKRWGIRGKSGRILFEDDDLDVVVKWFVKNYNQYRKQFPNS